MIRKQDRTPVRKAMDIEQKYDLNTDFSEIEKLAASAQASASSAVRTATDAKSVASETQALANSLSDSVAKNAEDISALSDKIDAFGVGGTSVAGTYVGTGVSGTSQAANSVTAPFPIKAVVIVGHGTNAVLGVIVPQSTTFATTGAYHSLSSTYAWVCRWTGEAKTTVEWCVNATTNNATYAKNQANTSGATYSYLVIG